MQCVGIYFKIIYIIIIINKYIYKKRQKTAHLIAKIPDTRYLSKVKNGDFARKKTCGHEERPSVTKTKTKTCGHDVGVGGLFRAILYHLAKANNEEKADIKIDFDDEEIPIIHIEKTK